MIQVGTNKMYSPDDVAQMLHVSKSTALKIFHQKEVKAFKIGRKYLVAEDNLNNYLKAGKVIL